MFNIKKIISLLSLLIATLLLVISCYNDGKHPNVLVISLNGNYERLDIDEAVCFNRTYKASPDENLFETSLLSGKYLNENNGIAEQTAQIFNNNDYNLKFIGDWSNCSKLAKLSSKSIPLEEVSAYKPFAFFITYTQLDSISKSEQKYEVEKLISKLKALNILDNTILFISYNTNLISEGMRETDIKICSELIYPGVIGNDRANNYLISSVDVLPTISDLCNLHNVDYSSFDGISLESYILNEEPPNRLAVMVMDSLHNTVITSNWKYISKNNFNKDSTIISEELYNLDTDPSEQNNLAHQTRFISKKIELQGLLLSSKK